LAEFKLNQAKIDELEAFASTQDQERRSERTQAFEERQRKQKQEMSQIKEKFGAML
jgi:hypothetical protein